MSLLLGCIADDITGASDLALSLASRGMPVTQYMGIPDKREQSGTAAAVIALKIRTAPVTDALSAARRSAEWLLDQGARQLYYKYCSTFDSTDEGNIGPVTNMLLEFLDDDFTVICPAFPANGRTIRAGLLYVGPVPLAESSMRNHPLTPMTRSSLIELMDAQTVPGATGHISLADMETGSDDLKTRFIELMRAGCRYVVADIQTNEHLETLAQACRHMRLVTGASALAEGLAGNFLHDTNKATIGGLQGDACLNLPRLPGAAVVLAGSCSTATRRQTETMRQVHACLVVDPLALASDVSVTNRLVNEAITMWQRGPLLISSESDPELVAEAQQQLGIEAAADLVESALGRIAAGLQHAGARKFIIAGGETSGAVAAALKVKVLGTGPRIDTGVPWMIHQQQPEMVLAFKSGNFGQDDFFLKAMAMVS